MNHHQKYELSSCQSKGIMSIKQQQIGFGSNMFPANLFDWNRAFNFGSGGSFVPITYYLLISIISLLLQTKWGSPRAFWCHGGNLSVITTVTF